MATIVGMQFEPRNSSSAIDDQSMCMSCCLESRHVLGRNRQLQCLLGENDVVGAIIPKLPDCQLQAANVSSVKDAKLEERKITGHGKARIGKA